MVPYSAECRLVLRIRVRARNVNLPQQKRKQKNVSKDKIKKSIGRFGISGRSIEGLMVSLANKIISPANFGVSVMYRYRYLISYFLPKLSYLAADFAKVNYWEDKSEPRTFSGIGSVNNHAEICFFLYLKVLPNHFAGIR